MSDVYETYDVIDENGITYRVEYSFDYDTGPPWKENDGHGVVSEFTARGKKPGEVTISGSRYDKQRFYDVAATMKIALRDRWGTINAPDGASKRQIAAVAVNEDMQRMQAWCNDDWHWCGVSVFPLTSDGDELRSKTESLWGIESDSDDYLRDVAFELIAEIKA